MRCGTNRPTALLKMFITRCQQDIARDAVQIFGGRGITRTGMGRLIEHVRGLRFYTRSVRILTTRHPPRSSTEPCHLTLSSGAVSDIYDSRSMRFADADRAPVLNSGGRPGRLGCPPGDQGDAEERETIVIGTTDRRSNCGRRYPAPKLLYTNVYYLLHYWTSFTTTVYLFDVGLVPGSGVPESSGRWI